MKTCLICKITKEIFEFIKDKQKSDGLSPYCKICYSEKIKQKREKRRNEALSQQNSIIEKLCLKCNQTKPSSEFHKDYGKSDYLTTYCKTCAQTFPSKSREEQNKRKREWRLKNKEKTREQDKAQKRRDYQKHKEKRLASSREYYAKNREKIISSNKEYYENNKEKAAERSKEYRSENAEIIKQKKQEYYQRPEVRKYSNSKNREWKKNNPEKRREMDKRYFEKYPIRKVIRNLRSRIRGVLKQCDGEKADHTLNQLGCSPSFLKQHLESKFHNYKDENGEDICMTWENYGNGSGLWEIDHIKALVLFDLNNKEEQLKANHYTNLQPLWWFEHDIKSKQDLKLKNSLACDVMGHS